MNIFEISTILSTNMNLYLSIFSPKEMFSFYKFTY